MSTQELKFKDIADAIRTKDGTTEPIVANDFAERIMRIQTGCSGGSTFNYIGMKSFNTGFLKYGTENFSHTVTLDKDCSMIILFFVLSYTGNANYFNVVGNVSFDGVNGTIVSNNCPSPTVQRIITAVCQKDGGYKSGDNVSVSLSIYNNSNYTQQPKESISMFGLS